MPVDESGGGGVKASELKGLFAEKELERRDKNALFDKLDKIDGQLKIIGNMVCDSQGHCRLATKEELSTLGQKEKKIEEFHSQELWNEIKMRPKALSDLEGVFLKKLKENPDYMKRAAEDPEFQKQFIDGVCTSKGCRERYNKLVEQYQKEHPEQKEH